ncbi:MAG: PAS domain S-box protein [Deltaproteobacteria bacterium]|nr:PAS domain S-box protein [Deltaproteobacteria bacterium]
MNTGVSLNPIFIKSLVNVTKNMHATMAKDDILAMFAGVFNELLPDILFSIRLINPDNGQLDLVYANGKLKLENSHKFFITKDSFAGLELSEKQRAHIFSVGSIIESDEYQCLFECSTSGFSYLLCDRKRLYGMINVEYVKDIMTLENDKNALISFVHLFVAALRNAALIKESILLKKYWEKLLYRANAPVVTVDRDGHIIMLNRRFEDMTGLTKEQLEGKEFSSLISPLQRANVLPELQRAMDGEPINNMQMRFYLHSIDGDNTTRSGEHYSGKSKVAHIAFNSAPVYNNFGQIETIIFVGQDLTLINELQHQIIHSEKLATLGQLAAGVAHELNNPLTSITVYTNYLITKLAGVIEENDLKKLNSISDGAKRIQFFAKDLVSYARPSDDHPELLNVKSVIERSVSFCEPVIAENFAKISIDINADIPKFTGIESQMEQVFVNLITNACFALNEAGGNVIISGTCINDMIEIYIEDNGIGILPDHIDRVCDPFFTTKDVGQGTGLGLSIVKNIVDNHNGEIFVKSTPGEGSLFTLKLRVKYDN